MLFADLRKLGHLITFHPVDDPTSLFVDDTTTSTSTSTTTSQWDERKYDTVLMFAPETEDFLGTLDTEVLTRFVEKGGNLFITATSQSSFLTRELTSQCGVLLEDEREEKEGGDDNHDARAIFVSRKWPGVNVVSTTTTVLFPNGVSMSRASSKRMDAVRRMDEERRRRGGSNILSRSRYTPILQQQRGVSTSSTADLVVAMEARNGARVVVVGSDKVCSDMTYNSGPSNRPLCTSILTWVTKETGVLRATFHMSHVGSLRDAKDAGDAKDVEETYEMNETIVVSIVLEERRRKMLEEEEKEEERWTAHVASSAIKVNVLSKGGVVVSSFLQQKNTLEQGEEQGEQQEEKEKEKEKDGMYRGAVQLPNEHGTYTIQVVYHSPGWSAVERRVHIHVQPARSVTFGLSFWIAVVVCLTAPLAWIK